MAKMTNSNVPVTTCKRTFSRKGFSLVELLCVITIVSILASVTGPAIVGMISGDQLTNNAYQLSGIAQQARTTAISQHTYVWLGFSSYTNNGAPAVMAAMVQIDSGLSTDLPNVAANYRLVSKPVVLRNATIAAASAYTGLTGVDSTDNTDVSTQTFTFPMSVPGNANATFTDCIVFGPDGQVYLPTSAGAIAAPTQCVGLGINAANSHTLRTAAIQIRGLSGQVSVFRQ
jgi:prepilin-type N-terminal cleavage/methylation domain-containing protein